MLQSKCEAIVQRIMNAHYDLASCRCWVCKAGTKAGMTTTAEFRDVPRDSTPPFPQEYPPDNFTQQEKDHLKHICALAGCYNEPYPGYLLCVSHLYNKPRLVRSQSLRDIKTRWDREQKRLARVKRGGDGDE